ncbi:hypothetical protein D3C81_1499600 [compost metagenome]
MSQGEIPRNFTRGFTNRFKYRSALTVVYGDWRAAATVFSGDLIGNNNLKGHLILRLLSMLDVNAHTRYHCPPVQLDTVPAAGEKQ